MKGTAASSASTRRGHAGLACGAGQQRDDHGERDAHAHGRRAVKGQVATQPTGFEGRRTFQPGHGTAPQR